MREHGRYPLSIYGKGVLTFCTYIVPYALVQYYPLMYLIGRHNDARAMLLPVIACVFIIPCYLFLEIRRAPLPLHRVVTIL